MYALNVTKLLSFTGATYINEHNHGFKLLPVSTGKANAGGEDPRQSESSPACLRSSGAEPNMFQVPEWNS